MYSKPLFGWTQLTHFKRKKEVEGKERKKWNVWCVKRENRKVCLVLKEIVSIAQSPKGTWNKFCGREFDWSIVIFHRCGRCEGIERGFRKAENIEHKRLLCGFLMTYKKLGDVCIERKKVFSYETIYERVHTHVCVCVCVCVC